MAGFGFLFFGVKGLLRIVGDTKEAYENAQNRTKHAHPDGLTYLDTRGCSRLLSNNHKAEYYIYRGIIEHYPGCKEGDLILEDIETHRLVANFGNQTEIKLQKLREEQKKKEDEALVKMFEGKTVYCKDTTLDPDPSEPVGIRLSDRKTGKTYVLMHHNHGQRYFLVDPKTWLIVKEVEKTKPETYRSKELYAKWKINMTIDEINQEIIRYRKEKNRSYLGACLLNSCEDLNL